MVGNKRRSGLPHASNNSEERLILQQIKQNPFQTSNLLRSKLQERTGKLVTTNTIRNKLHVVCFRTAKRKFFDSKVNREKDWHLKGSFYISLQSFGTTLCFENQKTNLVLWTDKNDLVWRKQGIALKKEHLKEIGNPPGGGTVLV